MLVAVVHHVVCDGHGFHILLRDLEALYRYRLGDSKPLRPLQHPAGAVWWSRRWNEHATSADAQPELDYWRSLGRPPPRPLFLEEPQAAPVMHTMRLVFDYDAFDELPEVGRRFGASFVELVLASLALAHHDVTNASRTLVAVHHHGRERRLAGVGCADMVGWLSFAVPTLVEIVPNQELASLARVSEAIRAMPNSGSSGQLLMYIDANPALRRALRDLWEQATFALNLVAMPERPIAESAGWSIVSGLEKPSPFRGPPLRVEISGDNTRDGFSFSWTWNGAIWSSDAVRHAGRRFAALLQTYLSRGGIVSDVAIDL